MAARMGVVASAVHTTTTNANNPHHHQPHHLHHHPMSMTQTQSHQQQQQHHQVSLSSNNINNNNNSTTKTASPHHHTTPYGHHTNIIRHPTQHNDDLHLPNKPLKRKTPTTTNQCRSPRETADIVEIKPEILREKEEEEVYLGQPPLKKTTRSPSNIPTTVVSSQIQHNNNYPYQPPSSLHTLYPHFYHSPTMHLQQPDHLPHHHQPPPISAHFHPHFHQSKTPQTQTRHQPQISNFSTNISTGVTNNTSSSSISHQHLQPNQPEQSKSSFQTNKNIYQPNHHLPPAPHSYPSGSYLNYHNSRPYNYPPTYLDFMYNHVTVSSRTPSNTDPAYSYSITGKRKFEEFREKEKSFLTCKF